MFHFKVLDGEIFPQEGGPPRQRCDVGLRPEGVADRDGLRRGSVVTWKRRTWVGEGTWGWVWEVGEGRYRDLARRPGVPGDEWTGEVWSGAETPSSC